MTQRKNFPTCSVNVKLDAVTNLTLLFHKCSVNFHRADYNKAMLPLVAYSVQKLDFQVFQ